MADNSPPPGLPQTDGEEGSSENTDNPTEPAPEVVQTDQQQEKPSDPGLSSQSTAETPKPTSEAEAEKAPRKSEEVKVEKPKIVKKVQVEKPEIPVDFYYDIEAMRRRPNKSEDVPDNFMELFHSFGYPCRMRNNLHALLDNRLIFGAGCYLQILHLDTAPQYQYTYLRTFGGGSIGAITVHPSGRYFAIGEKGASPNVTIFDGDDFRLYRILRKGTTNAYKSICFNEAGDLMATQGGDPDHMLTVWNWQQETILLRSKAFSQEVFHVSFNKELQGKLCTSGSGHIKFWNMARTFTGLKLQGQVGRFGRSAISDIEGLLEFPDGKVLSGSEWGNLLLWDENLIKVQVCRKGGKPCHMGQVMHMMMVEGEIITTGMDGYVRSWNFEQIDVLEAIEESALVPIEPMNEVLIGVHVNLYHLTQIPRCVKKAPVSAAPEMEASVGSFDESTTERHTWYCQDGAGGIWQADLSFRLAALAPKRLLSFHSGAIAACDVSPNTDLVMTLGEDGTLRLHDFLQRKLLAVKQFDAQGSCLVWIPGRVDKQLSTVMAGFSDGGIRRVAIDGSTTTLFGVDHMDCQLKLLQALKPHSATVTALAYMAYNPEPVHSFFGGRKSSLATCSEDCTVFFFNVFTKDDYQPHCYVPLGYVPRHLVWSPDLDTCDYLLMTCDDGIIIEMVQPSVVTALKTLEYCDVEMRVMRFVSIKSQLLHDQDVALQQELEEQLEKEREEENRALLEKGLETESAQNLRIEQENSAAMAVRKEKEEKEEPWVAYIPPTPSPILQVIYNEGGSKFWLMLGEYDSGYFYQCQFSQPLTMRQNEEPVLPVDTPPLLAVPVLGGTDDVITSHCFNEEGNGIFLGMKNGHIRLVLLDPEFDLTQQHKFWDLSVHDETHGAILGLKLSHKENYLMTVGEDGNFFVFSFMVEDQMEESDRATVPAGLGLPDEFMVEDLTLESYTIEQAKKKADFDELIKIADKRKQEKRVKIASLRFQFMRLVAANMDLPAHHQLSPEEFAMDPSLQKEAEESKKRKLEELYMSLGRESEKAELGYRKLYDYFRKHVHSDFFCVRAIASNHEIHSYRLVHKEDSAGIYHRRETHIRPKHDEEDEFLLDDNEDEVELARMVGTSPDMMEMGASERTIYLLKKMHAKRVKRAKRKIVWRKFLDTKPADDVEDPQDVEAIRWAKDNLGDRPLKSDGSYVVPEAYPLTMADGAMRLQKCSLHLQRLQMDFNARLLGLHDEKIQTIKEIRQMINRLEEIHERIDITHYVFIPKCPSMGADEEPGGQFQLASSVEDSLKTEVREKRRIQLEQTRHEIRESEFLKSRRKSSVSIAKENISRRQSLKGHPGPMSSAGSTGEGGSAGGTAASRRRTHVASGKVSVTDEMESVFQSPVREELMKVEQITLAYEQSQVLKKIEEKTQLFDIHHRQLRHEKFELDVLVKTGYLRMSTLQEELLLLMECEHVEDDIQNRIDTCLDQKLEMDKAVKQQQIQSTKLTKEIEENVKKEKALFAQLEVIIGENNPFRDYLIKVYKKKVKRKITKHETSSQSSSTESESDSSDDDEGSSADDDDDIINLDLNMCPINCSQEIYNKVVALREDRLDMDEQVSDLKRARDTILKDMDTTTKRRQGIDSTLSKAQKELGAFQLEKQQRMNALDVVTTIQLHQIQCLRPNGEFRSITNELLLSEDELRRLQNRIGELKDEKKEQRRKTIERRKLHVLLQYERKMYMDKLEEMDKECRKEMMKKFGQIVDLETVETVSADPQVEDVRSRLLLSQQQRDKELCEIRKQLQDFKTMGVHNLRLETEYLLLEADLKSQVMQLEKRLDHHMSKGQNITLKDDITFLDKDMMALMDLVAKQRGYIKDYLMEIQFLQGGPHGTPSPD